MPGELKNLVALAISSGSSKYHHQQQQQHQQEKKSAGSTGAAGGGANEVRRSGPEKKHTQARRSKEESNSGAKRFTKLLSKSVGAVSSTITTSSTPLLPPSDSITKKAPVASPESDGSSLLNGGSCSSATDHATGQTRPNFHEASLPNCDPAGDETPTHSRVTNETGKTWSAMNGSAVTANGRDREECSGDEASEEHWRSVTMTRHRCSTDASRGAETDDETMLSSVAGGTRCGGNTTSEEAGACKAPCTSSLTASVSAAESNEKARGWYATRKSYRSVAYKTWTVGAARKLLNSSRSDYDLPPSASSGDASRSIARPGGAIADGSVSDGEEKFYSCTYSRSQDDDLDRSVYHSSMSGTADSAAATAGVVGTLTLADLNKMKARKCASSDAVTLFAATRDPNSFLSPVDSVPSTSSDRTSSLSQPPTKDLEDPSSSITKNGDTGKRLDKEPESAQNGAIARGRSTDHDYPRPNHRPAMDATPGTSKIENGKSWLLIASSSSDDIGRGKNAEELSSRSGKEENNNKSPGTRIKYKSGSRSTGDCFSSEDYFKFTLKKRLMQQRQQQQFDYGENRDGGNDWPMTFSFQRNVTPPLLALDRDIRAALHNFDDYTGSPARSASPSRPHQVRSSSPTTLTSLMAAAQQRWRQQSERFTRRMERASCRGKIEDTLALRENGTSGARNHCDPFPLPPTRYTDSRTPPPQLPSTLIRIPATQLSSPSFSSSSSSSSSMSWISQGQSKQSRQRSAATYSPLAIAVDANGDHEDDWTPSDPSNSVSSVQRTLYAFPMRNRSKTTSAAAGASSPFRTSDEAMQFLKKELVSMFPVFERWDWRLGSLPVKSMLPML